jgi:hypothetical protein
MRAATFAGAAPHTEVKWQQMNWSAAHRNVRRLQARIVKATQEGRWGKVKALQHEAFPLVQWQSPCRQTSDGKPRQEHPWSRPRQVGYSRKEGRGCTHAQATRLSPSTAQAGVYPKKQQQTEATLDSVYVG